MDTSVARIASEGSFHSDCTVTANIDVSNDDEQYVDIGIDSEAEIKSALENLNFGKL